MHQISPLTITPESHIKVMKLRKYHPLNTLLIVQQILFVSTLGNVWRICLLALEFWDVYV